MNAWVRAVFGAAVVLLLAGCSSPAQTGGSPESSSSSASASTSGPAPALTNVSVRAPAAVPFQWSGHTKEGAWVCADQSGAGHCTAGQQVAPDGQFFTVVGYSGNLSALDLSMSWQADPTQAGLVLAAFGNTTQGLQTLGLAQGTSPLTLSVQTIGLGLNPDDAVMLMVWPQGKTPTSPSVFVDATQQAFTVDGTLWQTGSGA